MTKQDLMDIIVKVAPGSPLREGVDYILDAGIGALIVIGYDDEVEKVRDGGSLLTVIILLKEFLNYLKWTVQ